MKALITDDDLETRLLLKSNLEKWGYNISMALDGNEALKILIEEDSPPLVILDWMMPGMDGLDVCRAVRKILAEKPVYIILLTAKVNQEDIIQGLQAGADDFLSKPFDTDELRERLKVGERIINFQLKQEVRVKKLDEALLQVKKLQGFISICAYCKKIHADKKNWEPVESYISKYLKTKFSHTICPGCYESQVIPELEKLREKE